MHSLHVMILVAEALVMLFELRFLLQSSSADYYHPFTQAVLKLTNPLVRIPPLPNLHVGRYYVAGLVVAWIIALAFWQIISLSMGLATQDAIILGALMPLKVFGYLIFFLLIVQALTSWLPSTRSISILMYQITYPIVAPVQKVIPPIGMIDISLMIIIFVLYAINSLCYKVFGLYWSII